MYYIYQSTLPYAGSDVLETCTRLFVVHLFCLLATRHSASKLTYEITVILGLIR